MTATPATALSRIASLMGPCLLAAYLVAGSICNGEPRVDTEFRPVVTDPASSPGAGPLICVDAGHHNFHRLDGLFQPFGALMLADGYRVRSVDGPVARGFRLDCRVLVIANAQSSDLDWDDYPYPTPTAFSNAEVTEVLAWVRGGGRLLLIADHMPFPGAAASLAAAFGCTFNDGFAVADFGSEAEGRAAFLTPTVFSTQNGLLGTHEVISGRTPEERITQVATFSGQAFLCGREATRLLVLPQNFVSLMPRRAWQFTMQTPQVPVGGWLQGALMYFGAGRIAIFGEAGMFTAQITDDGRPMGMNAAGAEQNGRFVRNLMRWLAGP